MASDFVPAMVGATCQDAQDDSTVESPTPVTGQWSYLKETALKVKEDVEEDCEQKFPKFDAVLFIKRDNRIVVRVCVGDEKYVDVSLMGQQLHSYELNKKFNESLKFD